MSGPGEIIKAHETPMNNANFAGSIIYFSFMFIWIALLAAAGLWFRGLERGGRRPGASLKLGDVAPQRVKVRLPDKNILLEHRVIYLGGLKEFARKRGKHDVAARHLRAQARHLTDLFGRKISLDIFHECVDDGR